MNLSLKKLLSKILSAIQASEYRKGDSVSLERFWTAGYVTSSKTVVGFCIPLAKPVAKDVTGCTVTGVKLTLRQNGAYTHGSSSSDGVTPSSVRAYIYGNIVNMSCTMSSTTNAVNNAAIGVSTAEGGDTILITFY